jgi:glycosyltransferase involved in cell wall biosynthesis
MRILMIGHTYLVAENQKKLWAMTARPDVELTIITPHAWPESLFGELRPHVPDAAPFAVRPTRAVWRGREQFYWYRSCDLGMRARPPDILYVEQGAGALVYAQSLLYRRRFAPRAKAVFFTWQSQPYRARWPLRALERFNLRRSQGGVAGNADAARLLREHGFAGPLAVIPQLGVDTEEHRRRDAGELRRRLDLTRFTVGYVGRFVETKGIRVLLEALAGAEFDFDLLMVGRGPLEAEIRASMGARGWEDRLRVVSDVSHTEIASYQNCMDVLVLPSLTRPGTREQFGHVLVEAMACEVPVIGSDSGEVPNVIGDAGLVTPEGDVAALRRALADVASSAERRRRLGEAGRRRVLQRYTHEELARQLLEFFRGL